MVAVWAVGMAWVMSGEMGVKLDHFLAAKMVFRRVADLAIKITESMVFQWALERVAAWEL